MAYTNAALVRMLAGDVGLFARDVSSGDGVAREFYLSSPPIMAASEQVYVGGSLKSDPADYSLDDQTGRLYFVGSPAQGDDNIVVLYRAVQIPDTDVAEACRQQGLDSTAEAGTGEPPAVLRAAVLLCESMASQYASVGSVTLGGGGSLGQGGASDAWARRADMLRARAANKAGVSSSPTTRVDGYSQDRKSTDVNIVGENPRRWYYGEEDRIP